MVTKKPLCFSCSKRAQKYASGLCEQCHRVAIADVKSVRELGERGEKATKTLLDKNTAAIKKERNKDPIQEHLGYFARMISGSKSSYSNSYPDNFVIFNANVCTKEDGKIWYGDLDLTIDEPKLKALAAELQKEIYVLYEKDGRFSDELNPPIDRFVFMVSPSGETTIGTSCKDYYGYKGKKLLALKKT